jgi:formate hydrogenlyase subunit 3/multisubunit Na+/H+ antiporter MnhD subunit
LTGNLKFSSINFAQLSIFDNYFLFLCFLFGFGVKFAFFGFFKLLILVNLDINFFIIFPYLFFGLMEAVFKMFYQIDVKKLIAYSTVVEMH